MSKKKVAILISGFIRNWKDTYEELLKNVIEYNSDMYEFELHCVPYSRTNRYNNENYEKLEQVTDEEIINLQKKYNPTSFNVLDHKKLTNYFINEKKDIINSIKTYWEHPKMLTYKVGTIMLQAYAMEESYRLIETMANKYDLIIKTRFDVFYSKPCKIPVCEQNKILMLTRYSNQNFVDHVLCGYPKSMACFMKSYSNLENTNFMNKNNIKYAEDLFRETIKTNNISIGLMDWECELGRPYGRLPLYDPYVVNIMAKK